MRDLTPFLARIDLSDDERLVVRGGLNHLTGNPKPYFSITADLYYKGRLECCGCLHDEILKHAPHLSDLVALHLSDIDGIPMHAVENGWYWMRPHARNTKILASHFRVMPHEAERLIASVRDKAHLAQWVALEAPRFKREADACIARHNLVIYGSAVAA